MKSFTKLSLLLPAKVVKSYEQLLLYCDNPISSREFVGTSVFLSLIVALIVLLLLIFVLKIYILITISASVVTFILLMVARYAMLSLEADRRAVKVEELLPDALQLMSANMRAGVTIEKAIWLSARPEFGALGDELKRMAVDTLGGKPTATALQNMILRVKSVLFERSIRLLVQGMELGGQLSDLLVEIALDIRNGIALRREIVATTSMYTIFIIFASVLAAPMLFAVSTFYVETTTSMWTEQLGNIGAGAQTQTKFMKVSGSTITGEEVKLFAIVSIFITTFFGSLTIGMIKSGYAKQGLKYAPLFVTGALAMYFLGYTIIRSMFGALAM